MERVGTCRVQDDDDDRWWKDDFNIKMPRSSANEERESKSMSGARVRMSEGE